ncbi:MAG: chromosomal replication initiator protein DnaA [Clostridium sp.]|nr:chromosomal replication initiator protein DnaA [Clostridium sp.]MCM1460114.1 chromosomal replication initiator protein DnaA [Bacteroides sp.]
MKALIESKWEDILSLLETQYDISSIMINTWIRSLKIYEVKDNTIYFFVDEKLGENAVKFLRRKEFDLFLLSSIRETLNDSNIEIIIDEKKNFCSKEDTEAEKNTQSESYKEAISRSNLNPRYTFDTFIVGDGNKHAHATCLAVADMPAQDNFNPLFLYGNSGLGKTHLMQAIAHYILQKDDNINVLYVPSEVFTNEIIDAIRNHTTTEFREKYRKVDVLLLDDVQFLIGKESTQNEFFHTFNSLYNDKKQIILSSDKPPKEIKTLDQRIISRFECGVPIDIHEPDYETRMAILKNKAEMDHLKGIPDEVFSYIAENITNNVRELEGALNKIGIFSKLMNENVTLETAKESLKDIINKDNIVAITPDIIIKTVSEHMNISVDDICSKKRSQDIATARQIVMYLCREYTVLALKSIGNAVGGKDHATVINGIKRVEEKLLVDPSFKATVDTIIKKLNPNK